MRSLGASARQAVLWSAGLNLARDLLQFLQMLVLARLLSPEAYGEVGLATTVISVLAVLSFENSVRHVLQLRDDETVDYDLHFTAGLVVNGLLFLVANAMAIGVRFVPRYASLAPLVHWLSLTFLLSVPVEIRTRMLERAHDWQRLRALQLIRLVLSVAGGIAMAMAGAGVYALVVPGILSALVVPIDLFLVVGWKYHWKWDPAAYADAMRFGLSRVGSNALNSGRALLKNFLIAQHFSMSTLGIVGRAESLGNMACGRLGDELGNSLYPIITRADAGSARFRRIAGLVLRSVAWAIVPVGVYASIEARGLVHLAYGSRWDEVIPILPLAMAAAVTVGIGATAYRLLLANNQSRLCLRLDGVVVSLSVVAMVLLAPMGMLAFLGGVVAVGFASAVILLGLLVRTRGLEASDLPAALAPPLLGTIAGGILAVVAGAVLPGETRPAIRLLVSAPLFAVGYLIVLRWGYRAELAELLDYAPSGGKLRRYLRI